MRKIKAPIQVVIGEKDRYGGKQIRGQNYSHELYSNLLLVAKKKSGKTNIIYNYVKRCVGRETKVYVFSSTWYRDSTYRELRRMLEKKGIYVEGHVSLMDGKRNVLKELLENASQPEDEEEEGSEKEEKEEAKDWREHCLNEMFKSQAERDAEEEKPKRKREEKYASPEMIIILDDLHQELRNPVVGGLVTRNRHYKAKVILSTQYVHMVTPQTWSNLNICMLGGRLPEEKLRMIHERLDLNVPEAEFEELYHKATEKSYQFLYVDVDREEYRRNFNLILK